MDRISQTVHALSTRYAVRRPEDVFGSIAETCDEFRKDKNQLEIVRWLKAECGLRRVHRIEKASDRPPSKLKNGLRSLLSLIISSRDIPLRLDQRVAFLGYCS